MAGVKEKAMTKTKTINWKATSADCTLINKIANRAVDQAEKADIDYPKSVVLMDITAVHCNGNPLRLAELLAADDFNFTHDVFGIRRHIDRNTGKLLGSFSPRYSA